MAATQTLAQLRTRARREADQETGSAAAFCSDAEFNEYVNNGCQELFDKLMSARGHDYYLKSAETMMVAGQAEYALPADHYQTRQFQAGDTPTSWRNCPSWDLRDHARLINQGVAGTPENARVRLVAGNFVVLPTPASAFKIKHHYVYTFTRLAADGDTFDGVNGWEEFVVLYAAIRALKKEESFEQAAALEAELAKITARIARLASMRHQGEPMKVQDTRRDHVADWCLPDPRRVP